MSQDTRAALVRAVANLRHAFAQANLDRGIANGLIAPEIRRIEAAIDTLDADRAELESLVEAAASNRDTLTARVRVTEQALTRVAHALVPAAGKPCACRVDILLALEAVAAAGIPLPASIHAPDPMPIDPDGGWPPPRKDPDDDHGG